MIASSKLLPVVLLVPFLLGTAAAREAPASTLPPPDPRAHVGLVLENDALVGIQDRWYTNGLRFSWASAEDRLPGPLAWIDAQLAGVFGEARTRWGVDIGQAMYTPVDLAMRPPDPRDRPYAGYLFATLGLERRTEGHLDHIALQIGVTGQASGAQALQTFFHRTFSKYPPQGWGWQIKDEAMFGLIAERTWRLPVASFGSLRGAPLEVDALPAVNLAVGTVQVQAGAGGRLRIGQGLVRDFGPQRMRPASGDGSPPVGEGFGWYVFIGAYGRAVAHDIFLDGNITRDSRSVPREALVGDLEAGAALLFGATRLSFSWVLRSHEFQGQGAVHQFGSIALSTSF